MFEEEDCGVYYFACGRTSPCILEIVGLLLDVLVLGMFLWIAYVLTFAFAYLPTHRYRSCRHHREVYHSP